MSFTPKSKNTNEVILVYQLKVDKKFVDVMTLTHGRSGLSFIITS